MKFNLKTVTEIQVAKAIKSLKNKSSSGVDMINPKMVKLAAEVITIPLNNYSFIYSSRRVSRKLEVGQDIQASKFDEENYRPVSLLKSSSKVLEIIVNQQILNYLCIILNYENDSLFYREPCGYGERDGIKANRAGPGQERLETIPAEG